MWCIKCGKFHIDTCPLDDDESDLPKNKRLSTDNLQSLLKPYQCTCTYVHMGSSEWAKNPSMAGKYYVDDNCPIHGSKR